MKKIIILTLCATSFLLAYVATQDEIDKIIAKASSLAPQKKQCVSFADTAGEGCLVVQYYSDGDIMDIYEIKEEKVKNVVNCPSSAGIVKCYKE